jgi:LDH2 family malate/lactate/ureidoglycolate dehydrogenase
MDYDRHCGQDRRPLLPIQASFANAAQFFNSLLGGMEAGYKGYGPAMIIGLLAGTLGGAAMGRDVIDFNHDDDSVTNTGQAIAAINVAAFGDVATFKASVDALVRGLDQVADDLGMVKLG